MNQQTELKVGDFVTPQQEEEFLFPDLYKMDPDVSYPVVFWNPGEIGVVVETSHAPWGPTTYKGSLKVKVLVASAVGWIYADYLDKLEKDDV